RPDLTAERFLDDPFAGEGERMYRTGDLGRWCADGTIDYLGRNDSQVKIRGFRIELGEIEAALLSYPSVGEAVVIARQDGVGEQFLSAYYVLSKGHEGEIPEAQILRAHLEQTLPVYMLPDAYVRLPALPLTPNGKLDRKALPTPDVGSRVTHVYEAPQGVIEETLARIWQELLDLDQVGRHDNFFELGGHSMLAVRLMARMRDEGMDTDVRVLFEQPNLAALASVTGRRVDLSVPDNLIPAGCTYIVPEMLPLATLLQEDIDRVVATVPGGAAAVQDIYPLAPLQEGLLYHSLTAEQHDPYLLNALLAFDSRQRLDAFIDAVNLVIARHDVLRTSIVWKTLRNPVQVVWRSAVTPVTEFTLNPADGDIAEQLLNASPARLDIGRAPLLAVQIAEDKLNSRWLLTLLYHHLVDDATSLQLLLKEAQAYLEDKAESLPAPFQFRRYVAQVRLGRDSDADNAFFRDMLGTLEEPTLPYGLTDVQGDGQGINKVIQPVPAALTRALREQARSFGTSVASLFHLAWGRVIGVLSGREDVVFGTVLVGRLQGGSGHALGMFINTLPLRLQLSGCKAADAVRYTQSQLAGLLAHEHASLALAQRCSGVPAPLPLFSALLNYRHTAINPQDQAISLWEGIDLLSAEERTNYPLILCVDDQDKGLTMTVQAAISIDAERVVGYMQTALSGLVEALQNEPQRLVVDIPVLPPEERTLTIEQWGAAQSTYPSTHCIHEQFEAQAQARPDATAVVCQAQSLRYGELNARANQLAHWLIELGIRPDSRVAIALERSCELPVAILATLKAGGGYVPLDPSYPQE
ncbi:hypothetical protein KP22_21490, partial [Pectobacterium betavasculorum]